MKPQTMQNQFCLQFLNAERRSELFKCLLRSRTALTCKCSDVLPGKLIIFDEWANERSNMFFK